MFPQRNPRTAFGLATPDQEADLAPVVLLAHDVLLDRYRLFCCRVSHLDAVDERPVDTQPPTLFANSDGEAGDLARRALNASNVDSVDDGLEAPRRDALAGVLNMFLSPVDDRASARAQPLESALVGRVSCL